MATNNITNIYGPTFLPTTAAVLAAGVAAGTMVKQMTFVNSAASAQTVSVYMHNTTPGNAQLLLNFDLAVGDSAEFDGMLIVPSGKNLYGKSTSASAVAMSVHGMEMT